MKREQCVWISPDGARYNLMNIERYGESQSALNIRLISGKEDEIRCFDFPEDGDMAEHQSGKVRVWIAELDLLMGAPQDEPVTRLDSEGQPVDTRGPGPY